MFVTGNRNKVEELGEHIKMKSVKLTVLDLDLPEIQGSNVLDIVQEKCQRAFEQVNNIPIDGDENNQSPAPKRSVLIEDTSLHFNALNGMPGPYIKCKFRMRFNSKTLRIRLLIDILNLMAQQGS